MKRILFSLVVTLLPLHGAWAGIISASEYANDAAFTAATGAISLTGPLPNSGNVGTSETLGDATLSAGNTIFVGTGWSTLLPNDRAIAISGPENLTIAINMGLATAFGFYFHEPIASTSQLNGCNAPCAQSTFLIEFLLSGSDLAPSNATTGSPRLVALDRQILSTASCPNGVWSIDFVMDALANGRRIKCLAVVDDFTWECLDIAVDFGISGEYVARVLERIGQFRGLPKAIRTDQGPEFTSRALDRWAYSQGVDLKLIAAGKPTQNAYIESFNGKFRDE